MVKHVIAIDIGTNTGWASNFGGPVRAGTWVFPQKKGPCCEVDPRLLMFRDKLNEHCASADLLVYENVQFMRGRAQAFLWSGYRTVLWLFAHERKIPIICCDVKTLKKYATGNGNADKTAMALAYYEETGLAPGENPLDDNAIDAWHLCHWALDNL